MPILDREINLYPPELLTGELDCVDDSQWWALYTTSRKEKQLMRQLSVMEIPFYSPIVEKNYRSPAGRKRVSHVPLFANYVFLFGNEEARVRALTTNTISKCLPVEDGEAFREELLQIESLIQTGQPVTLESILQPGDRVRVKTGPMKGASGIVFQRRGVERLLVNVNFLQQGASVELNDWDVEAI